MKALIRIIIVVVVMMSCPKSVFAQIKVDVLEEDGRYVLWKEDDLYETVQNLSFVFDSDHLIACMMQVTYPDDSVHKETYYCHNAFKTSLKPGVDYTLQFYDTNSDESSRLYRIRYKPFHFLNPKRKQRAGLLSLRNKIW